MKVERSDGYPGIILSDGSDEITVGKNAADAFYVSDGTSYLLYVTSGLNFGIGTTTPSHKLDVNGTGRINGNFSVNGDIDASGDLDVTGTSIFRDSVTLLENLNADYVSVSTLDVLGDALIGDDIRLDGGQLRDAGGTTRLDVTDNADLTLSDAGGTVRMRIQDNGDLTLYEDGGSAALVVDFTGEIYIPTWLDVDGNVYAEEFIESSPYPDSFQTALAAVLSVERLPDESYDPNDVDRQLDHARLHEFLVRERPRNSKHPPKNGAPEARLAMSVSALVGAQNEVIKDLVRRLDAMEAQIGAR